mmetsp:Transcript_12946/g.22231  ORF Transcript_12946/g.22231 Transcript_12946/m.22231 type:complete len:208 (+) Transcript_12946:107-730(+)
MLSQMKGQKSNQYKEIATPAPSNDYLLFTRKHRPRRTEIYASTRHGNHRTGKQHYQTGSQHPRPSSIHHTLRNTCTRTTDTQRSKKFRPRNGIQPHSIGNQQQERQPSHSQRCLDFTLHAHFHAVPFALLGHPFSQCRYAHLPRHDDRRGYGHDAPITTRQRDQRRGYHELVRHGIQKRAERGGDIPSPRQKSIEPIGDRGQCKNEA